MEEKCTLHKWYAALCFFYAPFTLNKSGRCLLTTKFSMTKSLAIFWMDFSSAKAFFSAAGKPNRRSYFQFFVISQAVILTERRQVHHNLNEGLCALLSVQADMINKSQNSSFLFFAVVGFYCIRAVEIPVPPQNQLCWLMLSKNFPIHRQSRTHPLHSSVKPSLALGQPGSRWCANLYFCIFIFFHWE